MLEGSLNELADAYELFIFLQNCKRNITGGYGMAVYVRVAQMLWLNSVRPGHIFVFQFDIIRCYHPFRKSFRGGEIYSAGLMFLNEVHLPFT